MAYNPVSDSLLTVAGDVDPILQDYTEPDFSDPALEHWIRTEVVAACREYEQDPDSFLTMDELYRSLAG